MKHRSEKLWIVAIVCMALLALAPSLKAQPSGERAVPVERIVIEYEAGTFRIVSRIPLMKVLPPSDKLPGKVGSVGGWWFELQSADERTVYRKLIQDPTRLVFDGPRDGVGLPEPHEVALTNQVFTVLVPRAAAGSNLVLFGPAARLGAAARTAPAISLARIPLVDEPVNPSSVVPHDGGEQ